MADVVTRSRLPAKDDQPPSPLTGGGDAPEIQLVLGAAGVGDGDVRHVLLADLDWQYVLQVATRHGVLPLLARRLKGMGYEGVPQWTAESLTRYRSALCARNLLLSRQLVEILATLQAGGIEAIPYKGPVLAASAYGDLSLRPFADLDILVPPGEAARARSLLLATGYRSLTPRRDEQPGARRPLEYAFPLLSGDGRVHVEVHWKFAPLFPLAFEDVRPLCRRLPLLDSTVLDLSPEHAVLVLCVHGSKHAWTRLEWICAVAHLISRNPALDWAWVMTEAEARSASRALALGLVLAAELGGASVPQAVIGTRDVARIRPLSHDIRAQLFREPGTRRDFVRNVSLRLRSRSWGDRLRYTLHLRHPTEKDLHFLRLPPRLSFLYYAVRPVRAAVERTPVGRMRELLDRGRRRDASRALARQLVHQERKSRAIRGREPEVVSRMTERWQVVHALLSAVRPLPADARVLEVGSGAHGVVFASGHRRAVGVDPLAPHYARLFPAWQGRVPTVAAVGECLPLGDGVFDVVVCDNVVDHAERPAVIVAELARVLQPGGLLYFSVNVHHRLYGLAAWLHRTANAMGVPLQVGPFADHTVHLSSWRARRLFEGVPVRVLWEEADIAEAKRRARGRPIRHLGDLLARVFYKNARLVVVAERVT